jgi:murein DD-endopeptidase MepM/ murein hydrolase activator NlpD
MSRRATPALASGRRPSGPLHGLPYGAARSRRALRAAVVAGSLAAALLAGAGPAAARPAPPPNPSDAQLGQAQTDQQAAAAEVGRLAGLVASSQAQLEQYEVQAEAASNAELVAEDALTRAQAAADRAAAGLQTADDAVSSAQAQLADFSRHSYIDGGSMSSSAALLDAGGPGELIQRAATLDWVAGNQVDVLAQLQIAKVRQADAASAARAARDAKAAAEAAAATAKQAADAQLAAQQAAYQQVTAQKAGYDQQLQAAQVHLLELQGARDAYQQWVAQQQAAAAAAAAAQTRSAAQVAAAAAAARAGDGSAVVLPTAGTTSSCYGARWGVTHYGIDLAAPTGTPIYAATSGVVERAGPATGFGLAVYLRADDGTVTVYGHESRYLVHTGQRVVVGQQIAEVGARGQATGPHLHFEVHPDGELYGGAVDPAGWLRAHGIAVDGC